MNTNNPSSFFQSLAAQEKASRRAKKASNVLGDPRVFPTKILSIITHREDLFITESGNIARRVRDNAIYRGHTAPVTCAIVVKTELITGSWDKTIRVFDIESRNCLRVLQGHTDFIKTLLYIPSLGILSGSSDTSIRLWDNNKNIRNAHPRAVETMAYSDGILYTGGSEGSLKRWKIDDTGIEEIDTTWPVETSIYKLLIHDDSIFVASADNSARQLSLELKEENKFVHADYVRDLVVFENWCITACRDEEIRVWDLSSGNCQFILFGHFDEVSGLAVIGTTLFSVSLDATLRTWDLRKLQSYVEEYAKWQPDQSISNKEEIEMSAEELAELEELM